MLFRSLVYQLCKSAGLAVALVGNIGYSFARQVALDPQPLYVVEVSSFQLDDIDQFRPDIAILTNITEDHLDRYEYVFLNYIKSKFRITKNQQPQDYFIYSADDEVTQQYISSFTIQSTQLPISMKRDRKSTRLNSSHIPLSRMPSSA